MSEVLVRRTRWPLGASEQEIRDAAENEERKDFRTLVKLLLTYFKFPAVKEAELRPKVEAFLEKESVTPVECYQLYKDLGFFEAEDAHTYMEVGDTVYAKFVIYWVSPQLEAAYIFEYDKPEDSEDSEESDSEDSEE